MEPWGAEQEILADHLAELVIRRLVDPLEILLGSSGDCAPRSRPPAGPGRPRC
jgi:hypothetical protein